MDKIVAKKLTSMLHDLVDVIAQVTFKKNENEQTEKSKMDKDSAINLEILRNTRGDDNAVKISASEEIHKFTTSDNIIQD